MFGINRFVLYAIICSIAIAVFSTYVIMWRNAVRSEAQLEYNNKQLEQVITEQKDFMDKTTKLNQESKAILDELRSRNEQLNNQLSDVSQYLKSPEAKKSDRASSDILKKTIKSLAGGK